MPKKTGGGGHYNFIFFLNHVLHKIRRMSREFTGRTPNIFLWEGTGITFFFFLGFKIIFLRIGGEEIEK
jgi:hypothetical protein